MTIQNIDDIPLTSNVVLADDLADFKNAVSSVISDDGVLEQLGKMLSSVIISVSEENMKAKYQLTEKQETDIDEKQETDTDEI